MTELRTYHGSCHCGAIRFDVKTDLGRVIACNCSICSKAGWLLAFVPAEQFTLIEGGDLLKDYQFGKKMIHHTFCPVCGIHPFGRGAGHDGKEMYAINLRCLEDIDLATLTVTNFDGKNL